MTPASLVPASLVTAPLAPASLTPASLADAAAGLQAADAQIYFDISPLLEEQWTGIPIVAAGLAGALLAHMPARLHFFLGEAVISQDVVAGALRRRSGLFLLRAHQTGHARIATLPILQAGRRTHARGVPLRQTHTPRLHRGVQRVP